MRDLEEQIARLMGEGFGMMKNNENMIKDRKCRK
jgi:hypothetical protein